MNQQGVKQGTTGGKQGVADLNPPGFTIMELIVVVIIIGVLAAIAVPSYRIQMLKMKNQEAVRILMFLWEAQKDYYKDNGIYADNFLQLGIGLTDLPAPKNFNYPIVHNADSGICHGSLNNILADIGNSGGVITYTLAVVEDGSIFCCNWSGYCPKMGFPDF